MTFRHRHQSSRKISPGSILRIPALPTHTPETTVSAGPSILLRAASNQKNRHRTDQHPPTLLWLSHNSGGAAAQEGFRLVPTLGQKKMTLLLFPGRGFPRTAGDWGPGETAPPCR